MNDMGKALIIAGLFVLALLAGYVAGARRERRHAAELWRARSGIDPYRVDDDDDEEEEESK